MSSAKLKKFYCKRCKKIIAETIGEAVLCPKCNKWVYPQKTKTPKK